MKLTQAHLGRSLTLLALPLLMLGCANQPKTAPAPVVQPAATPAKNTLSTAPVSTAVMPEAINKAPLINMTPAPAPVGGILPAQAVQTDASSNAQIKLAQQALRKVVVLLPDRASLAEVNRDIEKGIKAAHQQHPHNPHLQLVFLHDALSGEALLQKAKSYAPDWIIGPLTKTDIQSLQSLATSQHIFLNRLDSATTALQIGLPAEDEIEQLLAQFKPNQGQLIVIASNDASEQRLVNYLTQSAHNKQLSVSSVTVEKQNADIRTWLINEGGIQSSEARIKRMTQLLRGDFSDTSPQARQDVQAIVFLGNAKQLRSIMPSLEYYRVGWPVYATSRLLPSKNSEVFYEPELNGVTVLAPPYLLNTQSPNTPFEALGWDSYQLLADPQAQVANTQTGKFFSSQQLNSQTQLKRQLKWVRIKEGRLSEINTP